MKIEPKEANAGGHGGGKDHEQKVFHIFVNTRPKIHKAPSISFEDIVALSNVPLPENQKYYMTYIDGPVANPEGELFAGESVYIQDGMAFDVSTTNQS